MPSRSMFNRLLFFTSIALVVGCGRSPNPQGANTQKLDQTPRAEVRFGGLDEAEDRHLPFKIIAVSKEQKLSMEFPFHVDGGEWLFFDCEAGMSSKAEFTVGVTAKQGAGGGPFAWERAALVVRDRETGGKFLELFSKSFPGKMPTPVQQPYSPGPLLINTAILGEGLGREAKGGFSGKEGGWMATKWFPEHDGRSAEIFFNYDLTKREGEFSEKDPEYADDLLAIWASALRDGLKPERTPDNDPNLTLTRPTIGPPRKLLSRLAAHYSFSPTGRFAVYQSESAVFALPLDVPNGEAIEIAHFDYSPWEMRVLNDDLDLIVQEGVAQNRAFQSSGDPMRIWWIDQKTKEKKLLRGPEEGLSLAAATVSPDLRFVALSQIRNDPGGKRRHHIVIIVDRAMGGEHTLDLQEKSLYLIGWRRTEVGLRAVAVTNRWGFDKSEPNESYLADPFTGELEQQESGDARLELDSCLSPDGKYRMQMGEDNLLLTDIATGTQKHFVFHEDDRQFMGKEAIEWISPRYLKFNGQRLALIDITTMKMCCPALADGTNFGSNSYKFSPDFRWVMYQGAGEGGEGLFLAPVKVPHEQ